MQKYHHIVFSVALLALSGEASVKTDSFLNNFEVVPTEAPESLGAPPKCGEGVETDKFKCVPYYNCDINTGMITNNSVVDGSNNIQYRVRAIEEISRCEHYLDVCCQVPKNMTKFPPNNEIYSNENTEIWPCGFLNETNLTEQNSVRNDELDKSTGFPWLATLLNKQSEEPFCEGSLITSSIVLTSAHCVWGRKPCELRINAGNAHLNQSRSVRKIIIHEHYVPLTLYNDLALLVLKSSLKRTKGVGTICLPRLPNDEMKLNCFTTSPPTVKSKSVKAVNNTLFASNKQCQENLRTTKLGNEFILHRSFACAQQQQGTEDCSTQLGGSPLICSETENADRGYVLGVNSWTIGCNTTNGGYSIYANVSVDWIETKFLEMGISLV